MLATSVLSPFLFKQLLIERLQQFKFKTRITPDKAMRD